MPNVSELARLDEEQLRRELTLNKAIYANLRNPKACREAALREVRSIERRLGLTGDETVPEHNHRPAVAQDDVLELQQVVITLDEMKAARRAIREDHVSLADMGTILGTLAKGGKQARDLFDRLTYRND